MRQVRRIGALALILTALLAPAPADASPAKVAALQSALQALRLYSGYVDGIKGPLTRHGVRALQHRRGLPPELGWAAFRRGGAGAVPPPAPPAPAPADASPAKVAALQSALQALRLYSGYVDGIKGPLTRHGVRALQHRRGLHVDGVVGP